MTYQEALMFTGPTICSIPTSGPYDCDCPDCAAAMQAEHEAEMYAEGAWLRAAEHAIPQHELDYELDREAMDPGLAHLRD